MELLRYLFTLAAVSSGVSAVAKSYDLIDLGTPGPSFYSFSVKMNNVGTLAVTGQQPTDPNDEQALEADRAFVYRFATYTPVPNPTPWNGSTAEDINDHNELVGFFYFFQFDLTAGYVYNVATGTLQLTSDLNGLLGSTAYRINNASQILGDITALQFQAWVYDSATGATTDVDQASGLFGSFAYDLNDQGQLLLTTDDFPQVITHVYTLATDTLETLPAPPSSAAFNRLNDFGTLAGTTVVGEDRALILYENGAYKTVAPALPSLSVRALDNRGRVVGSYGPFADRRAFLYNGHAIVDLNTLVPKGHLRGWTLRAATDINDRGQITGYMTDANGAAHVYLLKPRPGRRGGPR